MEKLEKEKDETSSLFAVLKQKEEELFLKNEKINKYSINLNEIEKEITFLRSKLGNKIENYLF